MANTMQVSLVAADREVWSGEATVVNARTLAGEMRTTAICGRGEVSAGERTRGGVTEVL